MKIGFIFYSESGHTLSVLNQLEKVYKNKGHFVEKISLYEGYDIKKRILTYFPKANEYDLVLFASPVQAFSLAIPMVQYLEHVELKKEQKIQLLLTQHFKRACFGGNRALRQMKKAIQGYNPVILCEGIVHWSSKERELQIEQIIAQFGSAMDE